METYAVSQCRPAGVAGGKPCWITEWGFSNSDKSCPLNDSARAALTRETMNDFRDLARQGKLASVFYYSWDSAPGSGQINPSSVFRCGVQTDAWEIGVESLVTRLIGRCATVTQTCTRGAVLLADLFDTEADDKYVMQN
jgi:hypothetical protein